jgi:hypothetical protein
MLDWAAPGLDKAKGYAGGGGHRSKGKVRTQGMTKGSKMILTQDILERGRSQRGGWNRLQFKLIGISWPPVKGWVGVVIGQEYPDEVIKDFLRAKDKPHYKSGYDPKESF